MPAQGEGLLEPHRLDEEALVFRLLAGDTAAFSKLVDDLHPRLLALARTFTRSPQLAEDIAQETWLGVIRGLGSFEGRSSLRTWIFSILVRRARTLAVRHARRSNLEVEFDESGPYDSAREWAPGGGRIGLWDERPVPWGLDDPAALFQSAEALVVIGRAVDSLPSSQRRAVLLRDVEDIDPHDVCNILAIRETNLRVLLHRGRAAIRRAIDRYLRGEGGRTVRPRADAVSSTTSTAHPGES
jgi:RNA polymerase sigma-70 factor (ECF subfamily)